MLFDPGFIVFLLNFLRDSASYVSGCSDRIRMENHGLAFCPLPLKTPPAQKIKLKIQSQLKRTIPDSAMM